MDVHDAVIKYAHLTMSLFDDQLDSLHTQIHVQLQMKQSRSLT